MPPPVYTDKQKIELRRKQNGRILCIVTKDKGFPYKWYKAESIDTVKCAVPEDMTLHAFKMELYKILKSLNENTPISDAIYLSSGNRIIGGNNYLMGDLSKEFGHLGMIYFTIHGESTFG